MISLNHFTVAVNFGMIMLQSEHAFSKLMILYSSTIYDVHEEICWLEAIAY